MFANLVGFRKPVKDDNLPVVMEELNKNRNPNLLSIIKFPYNARTALPVNDPQLERFKKTLREEGINKNDRGVIPNIGQRYVDESYFGHIDELRKNAQFEDFKIWQIQAVMDLLKKGPVARKLVQTRYPYMFEGVEAFNDLRRNFEARIENIGLFGMRTHGDYYLLYEISKDPQTFRNFLNPENSPNNKGPEVSKLIQIWRQMQLADQISKGPPEDPKYFTAEGTVIDENLYDKVSMGTKAGIQDSDTTTKNTDQSLQNPHVRTTQQTLDSGQRAKLGLPSDIETLDPKADEASMAFAKQNAENKAKFVELSVNTGGDNEKITKLSSDTDAKWFGQETETRTSPDKNVEAPKKKDNEN